MGTEMEMHMEIGDGDGPDWGRGDLSLLRVGEGGAGEGAWL